MTPKYVWIALGTLLASGIGIAHGSGSIVGGRPGADVRRIADADIDHEDVRKLREAGEVVPLEQLIAKTRRLHPGRLIEAELEKRGGRYVYELEYVDDAGTVWEFRYDAHTGELLGREHED